MKQPELKAKTNELWNQLTTRAKYTKGWNVEWVDRKDQSLKIRFTCIHGRRYDEEWFPDVLIHAPNTKGIADQTFQRALKWCKSEHIDVTPNTWYSIAPLEINTIALTTAKWATPGQWITPTDWTISWNPPDYTNMVYGGNKSIVGELLAICPGLGKVQRPCPECKGSPALLTRLIPHVNDSHQWSREKIAEWLDIISLDDPTVDFTIQPKKEQKSEQPSVSPSFKIYEEIATKYYGTLILDNDTILKEILGAGS